MVTGGAKGIGEGCVKIFHRQNGNVAVLDVDETAGKKLCRQLGERTLFVKCDVSKEEEVKDAVKQVFAEFGGLDILVNNAGILRYSIVTETPEAEWDNVLNVNVKGAFLCAKHAIPYMLKKGAGVVINMSSVQAHITQENVAAYATSKSALLGLTRSIAVDYAPQVRSVAICPGAVDTPLNQEAFQMESDPDQVRRETENMHLVQRMAQPEEIGELAAFVASDNGSFITAHSVRIDGGMGAKSAGPGSDSRNIERANE